VSIHANSHAEILVDKSLLEQIVMNLVTNACEAMPNGGKLTVETSVHDVEEPQVMIAVTDTGVGMDRETVSKLFEPFYTTKEVGQGVGLGLAAVHGIVKQSGGSVWAYSEPGRGTTLKIYLPKVGNAATYQADKTQIGSVKGKETILLAEDELVVRTLVSECLAKNGYHVIEATQGSEALDKAKERRGLIDLLLTDIVMPEMNGKELADALTAEFPKISVLFMSGYAGKAMLRQGVSLDGADFIQKPFVPDQLLLAVRKVLDQRLVVG
jgi:two-component system cell cycle sensor histidine kinase/response regulator CckA